MNNNNSSIDVEKGSHFPRSESNTCRQTSSSASWYPGKRQLLEVLVEMKISDTTRLF
jgi:hypothetical protein